MSSSNRSSRSCSLPRQHQSRLDEPSEPIRKRNQSRSVGRPSKSSVGQKIVGPTKSYITKAINNAEQKILLSKQCLEYLSDSNASNADQDELQEADKLLLQVQEASHQLSGLDIFVASKFNNPLIRSSPDREKFFQEVQKVIQDGDCRRKLVQLNVNSQKLANRLTELGATITPFIPSSTGELTGSNQEVNTEDSASDPSLHIDPLAEPRHRDSQNEVNAGAPRRLIAAPRLFETEPRIDPLATAPEPSAPIFTQQNGLFNADNILSLQKELEFLRKQRQCDALKEERLRTLLTSQREKGEKLSRELLETQQLIKQVSDLNVIIDTQAKVKPTSARNTSAPITTEPVHRDPTPETTQRVSTTDRILWEMHKSLTANNKIQQKLLEAIESQQKSAPSARDEAADDQYIRDYEEQFNADEPTGEPEQPSTPLHDDHSSSPHVHQATPHKGMKLEAMMKIMTPYDGTGNLNIFKRNFEMLTADPSLTPNQRNMILQSNLKGEARTCVVEKEDPAAAIKLTFEMLDAVYGKNTNKRNIEEKLADLKFNQTDPRVMRLDLAAHQVVFHSLRDQGVSECDERPIEILAAKLPAEMRRNLSLFMTRQGDNVSQAAVIAEIGVLIDSLARDNILLRQANVVAPNEIPQSHLSVNFAKASQSNSQNKESKRESPLAYNAALFQNEFFDPISKTKLPGYYAPGTNGVNLKIFHKTFPFEDQEATTCPVCEGKHHPIRCPLASGEFRRILTAKSLCHICARTHHMNKCRALFRCGYCDGLHHMGGCPQKEHYRDMANYPAGAKTKAKFFRAPNNRSQ